MFRRLSLLLLLLCFINYSESTPVGNISIHVTGQKGEDTTLPCDVEARDISHVILSSLARHIPVCEMKNCSGRFFKKGSCDIIIKDLHLSDAGKYFLRVYYNTEEERQIRTYQLQIHDEISVKTGEELKMDVLLINADKVEKNSSGEWTEVWTRGHGVSSDRLTDRDGNLTISNFTVSDTGTYRVLDSEGEILITVTVTESKTESNRKLGTDEDKLNKQHDLWSIVLRVTGALLTLMTMSLVIFFIIRKHKHQLRYYMKSPQGAQGPSPYDGPRGVKSRFRK